MIKNEKVPRDGCLEEHRSRDRGRERWLQLWSHRLSPLIEDLEMFRSMASGNKALGLWGDAEKTDTGERNTTFHLLIYLLGSFFPRSPLTLFNGPSETINGGRN